MMNTAIIWHLTAADEECSNNLRLNIRVAVQLHVLKELLIFTVMRIIGIAEDEVILTRLNLNIVHDRIL